MSRKDKLSGYEKYYDENNFLTKLKKLVFRLGEEVVIHVLMLWFLLLSGKVPIKTRLLIMAALGYLVMPADLVSDFIPALGFTDDVAFLTYAFNQTSRYMDESIRRKAVEKLQRWMTPGEKNQDAENLLPMV